MKRQPAFSDPQNLPPELRVEALPRPPFKAHFDNCILTLELGPGRNQQNAVLLGWKDPIRKHDAQVLEVERLMDVALEKEKEYSRQYRTFRNWESAWLFMNTKPDELEEYIDLKAEMKDFNTRIKFIQTVEEKMEAEDQWNRFRELQDRCERLLAARTMLERVREVKDAAFRDQIQAARDLDSAKDLERELAEQISEDHVDADSQGLGISQLFPNISPGYIITRVNRIPTEEMLFSDILKVLEDAKTPHELEFRRYDFRQNVLSGRWESLQELRAQGRYVEDPRVQHSLFIDAARRGSVAEMETFLSQGMDIEVQDQTKCTALHHACANGHFEIMEILRNRGASLEVRDGNMETPLLHAARRGDIAVVQWLLTNGANIDTRDRLFRTPLFHAILSKNTQLVSLLVERRSSLSIKDKYWKWTPLHYAASVGSTDTVELLLSHYASPYSTSEVGWTPLRCAEENACLETANFIREFIFEEPAQRVLPPDDRWKGAIWVGCHRAADVRWATDRGFDAILSIYRPGRVDPKHHWLDEPPRSRHSRSVKRMIVEVDALDTDDSTETWANIMLQLPRMLVFIDRCMQSGLELLVHCETGLSTSCSIVLAHILVKRKVRLEPAVELMKAIRRQISLAPSALVGLKDLQEELDQRKLERLENRLRTSPVLSIAF